MAAGSIILDLLFRTGSFETDTKRAEKRLKELKREAQDAGRAIGLGIAAAGAAVTLFVKNAIDSADAAGKSAAAAGLAVESYTALAYAADLAGVEAGALGTALNTLNKNIGTNDKAFEQLGITVRDSAGNFKATDQVLGEIADRFANLPAGPRKSQLALELFGKSGAALIPLLNQGSAGIAELRKEAERLGIVVSTQTARDAEEFNDNMTRLRASAQGLALVLAKEVLPTLTQLSNSLLKNARDFGIARGSFVALFETILGGTEPADLLQKQINTTRETIKGLEEQIARAEKAGANPTGLKEMREELQRLTAEGKRSTQALVDVLNIGRPSAGGGRGSVNPERVKFDAPDAPDGKKDKARTSEAQRYLETLQKQSEETLELTSLEKALLDIQQGRIEGLTPTLRKQILAQAEFNDLNKQAIDQRDAQIAGESARARAALDTLSALEESNKQLREEIALIGLDEIGILGVERARISSARAIKEEQRARQELAGVTEQQLQVLDAEIAALREREELLGQKIGRTLEERSKESAEKTGKKLQDTLGDSIEQGVLDGFRRGESLADIFLNELKAQFAKTILRPVIQPVADAGNSLIGDILGAIGGAFGGSGFNPVGDQFSGSGEAIRGRRARGGEVHPGGAYMVGEEGPEPFIPSTSGRILPADSMGGGGDVAVIVNAPPGTTVERQQTRTTDGRREIEVWLANRIASGASPVNGALKSRGVNTSGNLPRRS